MVYCAIVAKSCSRSHGQPVTGARSAAMISSNREISREGVMGIPVGDQKGGRWLYAASDRPIPAERAQIALISTDWPAGPGVVMGPNERPHAIRNRAGAVFRRTGFHH